MTTNRNHPAHNLQIENVTVLQYDDEIDFNDLFSKLKSQYGVEKLTVQTGSTLNAVLLRAGLIDRLLLVVAPVLIGGKDTPSLIGGQSVHVPEELSKLKPLKLIKVEILENSYLRLNYHVLN